MGREIWGEIVGREIWGEIVEIDKEYINILGTDKGGKYEQRNQLPSRATRDQTRQPEPS